jgi:4-hydroxy-tetrahydrodipicolinate synthase
MDLSGCGTALVTPFAADGSVDESALVSLVNWQIESDVNFIVACGTTGEASTMTEAENQRVIDLVIETAAGRVPIIAGCSHNATSVAVERAKKLSKTPGLNGLLTANPYYNRPGQEGQFQHFRAVIEASALPILIYNIPSRTGTNLEATTVLRLAELTNVVGIKESSGNLAQIAEIIHGAPHAFKVFSGDDSLTLPILALGGVGVISVASNAVPAEMAQMVQAALVGDWATARAINKKFLRLMQANFSEPSPAPIKAVLALLGHGEDHLRLPMIPVTPATRDKLKKILGELGLPTK